MRRTKATLIYRRTKNLRAVQLLLVHSVGWGDGQVPRHRGGRRPRDFRADRNLIARKTCRPGSQLGRQRLEGRCLASGCNSQSRPTAAADGRLLPGSELQTELQGPPRIGGSGVSHVGLLRRDSLHTLGRLSSRSSGPEEESCRVSGLRGGKRVGRDLKHQDLAPGMAGEGRSGQGPAGSTSSSPTQCKGCSSWFSDAIQAFRLTAELPRRSSGSARLQSHADRPSLRRQTPIQGTCRESMT